MIRVRLRVVSDAARSDEGEDWGEWDFVSLPRAGDVIDVSLDGEHEALIVSRVVHFAAQHPLPRSEMPYRQRKTPLICVIAARSV